MSEPAASWERLTDGGHGLVIAVKFSGTFSRLANERIPGDMLRHLRSVLAQTQPAGVVYDIGDLDASFLDAFAGHLGLMEAHWQFGERPAAIAAGKHTMAVHSILEGTWLPARGVDVFETKEEALAYVEQALDAARDSQKRMEERSRLQAEHTFPQREDLRRERGAATSFPNLYASSVLSAPFFLAAVVVFIGSIVLVPPLAETLALRGRGDLARLLLLFQYAPPLLVFFLPNLWNVISRYRWSRRFPVRMTYARLRAVVTADPDRFAIHVHFYGGGFDTGRLSPAAVVEDLTTGELAAVYPSTSRLTALCETLKVKTASYF